MQVARAAFIRFALVISVGQFEHSNGAFTGDPPYFIGKTTASQASVLGLAILLVVGGMANS